MSRPKAVRRFALGLALGAIALCAVGRAAHARGDPRLAIELATGISGSTELRTVVMTSPLFTLAAPITDVTSFTAQWGFTVANGEPTSAAFAPTFFAVGNPLFGCSIVLTEGLVFSPALTLPLASAPLAERRRPAATFAFEGGLGLRGELDRWLWDPDELTFILPLAYVHFWDPILLETQLKLAFLGPTAGDPKADAVLQWKARIAARLGGGFWIAAGVSGVYTSVNRDDLYQTTVFPEVRYVLGAGSHIGVTLTMNVDGPYGPFSSPGHFWGVVISGSATL